MAMQCDILYYGRMELLNTIPIALFETPEAWEAWLVSHWQEQEGRWLKIAKKNSGVSSVTYAEALEISLCHGWIDGQKKSYDEQYFLQKFTPRRKRSIWSKVNVGKIADLTEAGRMRDGGVAQVEAAKADGRWEQAYDSARTIETPDDFREALDQNPKALEFWSILTKSNTYTILWRIQTAKRPETRQARIEQFIDMLNNGEKIHSSF
jgi:uncharacterized protein YdeI (YjbR/CyaY-like superfamily)